MAARKATTKATTIIPAADILPIAEKAATGKAGTTTVRVDLTGTTEKLVTDRVRRVARVKGWNALSVKRTAQDGAVVELQLTNTGQQAEPWRVLQEAAKRSAKATKAPAKASAKKATKAPAKKATKAPAKSARKAPAAKRQTRKAS